MTNPQWRPEEQPEGDGQAQRPGNPFDLPNEGSGTVFSDDPFTAQQPSGAAYSPPGQPQPMAPTDSFGQPPYGQPGGYPVPPSYPATPYGLPLPPYASWGQRAKAALLDIFLPMFAVSLVLNIFWPGDPYSNSGVTLLYDLVAWSLLGLIHAFTSGNTGQSWGRRWAGTKLVGEDGKPIGFNKTVLHYTLHAFDSLILMIGFLWPLWDPKRQTLISDKALKTFVVVDQPAYPFPPAAPYQPR